MVAGVVHLVELVAAAEFGADRVPQQLHDLDALAIADAVRAPHILREVFVDLRVLEILRRGRQVDQRGGDDLLDDLLDAPIGVAGEHPVARAGLRIGQHRVAHPRHRVHRHRVGDRPEQVAPRDHLAEHRLVAAELLGAGGAQRLGDDADHEIELYRQPRAALELVAVEKARARIEHLDLLDVAVEQHVLPRDQHVVEHEDGVVLVEPRRQRIVEDARQNSFTPGAFIGAMNITARSESLIGIAAFWPRKL